MSDTTARRGVSRRLIQLSALVFFGSLLVYGLTVLFGEHTRSSGMAYFNELAGSFLRGRLDVPVPSSKHDLTLHEGRWYLPFPPLPALLLLPWVVLFGANGVNSVLFSIVVAAGGVTFAHLLLDAMSRRGLLELDRAGRWWLTTLFGFGTVYWSVAILGSVWYLGQITSVMMVALSAWLAAERAPRVAVGATLGLALLGRPNLVLSLPLIHALREAGEADGKSRRARAGLLLPIAAAIACLLAYNAARFGSPFDFGYREANVPPKLASDLETFGQFHWRYLERNLAALLWLLPRWERGGLRPDFEGMSIVLTTPAALFLLRARGGATWMRAAWLSFALLLLPLLTYYNTGWMQFGYRFSLDFSVPMLLLLAVAAGSRPGRLFRALILVGVLVNLWGAWWWMEVLRHF
ncbi:MAG: hypothetical protein U0527_16670 [Candidatus Eisenbacteria bacterium]